MKIIQTNQPSENIILPSSHEKKKWMSPTIEHWEHIHIEISQGGGVDSGHSAYIV